MEFLDEIIRDGMHIFDVGVAQIDDERVFLVLLAIVADPAALGFLDRVSAKVPDQDFPGLCSGDPL